MSLPVSDQATFEPPCVGSPLTTSAAVKAAMMHDYGSRDPEFIAVGRRVCGQVRARRRLSRSRTLPHFVLSRSLA